ncbi:MAG: FAD-dependent monooxygenase [Planctomycetota bacterium]
MPERADRPSVVVIGGAVAGAAAATHLARRGARVTVVESAAFPRAKVCGEFVSPAATGMLETILPPDQLRSLGARTVETLTIRLGNRTRSMPMPMPAWALGRRTLDGALLDAARCAGATIKQPERVTDVCYRPDGVRVDLASGATLEADMVIHADGKGRYDPAGPTPQAANLVGLKCHARLDEPVVGIRLHAGQGIYCGGIAIEDGLTTLALCVTPNRLAQFDRDKDALLADVWPGFSAAHRVGPWLATGVARSDVIRPGHARSWRIGNAGAAVDPVGGEGMGLALWSAHACAEAIGQAITPRGYRGVSLRRAKRRYLGLADARYRWRRPACRLAAWALMTPAAWRTLSPALASPRLVMAPWYRLTGKPILSRPSPS